MFYKKMNPSNDYEQKATPQTILNQLKEDGHISIESGSHNIARINCKNNINSLPVNLSSNGTIDFISRESESTKDPIDFINKLANFNILPESLSTKESAINFINNLSGTNVKYNESISIKVKHESKPFEKMLEHLNISFSREMIDNNKFYVISSEVPHGSTNKIAIDSLINDIKNHNVDSSGQKYKDQLHHEQITVNNNLKEIIFTDIKYKETPSKLKNNNKLKR
jgi:hypothetical protein